MQPQIHMHLPAMAAAFVVAFVFGFLWYGPLFGKTWAGYVGIDFSKKPSPEQMRKSMILQVLGLSCMIYVLSMSIPVWRPSSWGVADADGPDYIYAFFGAFFTWLGFKLPVQFGKVAWEGRPWKLLLINAPYDFLNLFIAGLILSYWRS